VNKIVRKHYPASKLPSDLRGDISSDALVEVVVTKEATKRVSRDELIKLILDAKKHTKPTTEAEAVSRIRKLRDEWDY